MAWLNGASDLTTVVKSFYTGGSAIQKKDWGSLGASAATIVGKGLMYAAKQNKTLADALTKGGKKFLPTPTAIVDFAALAITIVDFLNGFGTPNAGSSLSTAADKFSTFTTALQPGCVPDARDWSGTAATAYTSKVKALSDFTATMNEYDKELKGHLKSQADKIATAHMTCTINTAILTAAAGIAMALYLIPIVGPEISLAWQIIAAFACCAATFVIEMLTLANSMSLSNDVALLSQKYVQLGSGVDAAMKGTYKRIHGEVATQTSSYESVFKDISANLKSFYEAPTVRSLAARAGDSASPAQRATLKAFADAEQESAYGAREEVTVQDTATSAGQTPTATPPVPEGAAPAAPAPAAPAAAFTIPSLAQVSAMSGQASKISQNVSQPVNQTMQQVQQFTSMGQQGQGAPPAPEDAVEQAPAEETADAGASSGKEASERAPIDGGKSGAEPAAAGRERVL